MSKNKRANTGSKNNQNQDNATKNENNRETKIINSIVNTSVIMMSAMMDAFTEVMVNATGVMATGIADAIGGKEAEQEVRKEFEHKLPEIDDKMKMMISEMHRDVHCQIEQKRKTIEPLLSDPEFDIGPKIVEEYNFTLPKLTETLDDSTLAKYTLLLVSEDPQFTEMLKKLTEWMDRIPNLQTK